MMIRHWLPIDTLRVMSWMEADPLLGEQMCLPPDPWPMHAASARFNYWMRDPRSIVFAVDSGGSLLGFMAATSIADDGSAQVHAGVDPARRGRGGLMMKRGVRFGFEVLGLKKLVAIVPPGRDDIERLDKAIGFREIPGKILVLEKDGA